MKHIRIQKIDFLQRERDNTFMNENNDMSEPHRAVVDLQNEDLVLMKSTPETVVVSEKSNFFKVAKEMFDSVKPAGVVDFIVTKGIEGHAKLLDTINRHPIASSVISVPIGVATALTFAFLFR